MKTAELFPDGISSDHLKDVLPTSLSYPTTGIWSPFELQRMLAWLILTYSEEAISKVQTYATSQQEKPYAYPDPIASVHFQAKPVDTLSTNKFPALFITFGGFKSYTRRSITSSPKQRVDATSLIMVTPVLKDRDPDLQEVKMLRLCAAIEYIILDAFNNTTHSQTPTASPFNYLQVDTENIFWYPAPNIALEDNYYLRIFSMSFDFQKRFQ